MTTQSGDTDMSAAPAFKTTPNTDIARAQIAGLAHAATRKIAPLWPLKHFVAVNPFLGFTGQTFEQTCATFERVAKTRMLMPRAFYRDAIDMGEISDEGMAEALKALAHLPGLPASVGALKAAAQIDAAPAAAPSVVATVAEVLDRVEGGNRQASRVAFMIEEIARFCAAYFDAGQASWKMPLRGDKLYAAWRAGARHDLNPEMMGVKNFRKSVLAMPEDPVAAIAEVVERLAIPPRAVEDYLHRALFDIGGWAAYARYLVWEEELYGRSSDLMIDLLAIRIVWGYGLFAARQDAAFKQAWADAMAEAHRLPVDAQMGLDPQLAIDAVLQEAYEASYRRRLVGRLQANVKIAPSAKIGRPKLQAAFCIDVRSEYFRRALETVNPGAETVGFAGFFGFPIEYVPIGQQKGGAQCPVLLTPAFTVCEAVKGAGVEEETEVLGLRLMRRRAGKAWKSFKLSAVSSFSFVETIGLGFAGKIISDSLHATRPVADPMRDGFDSDILSRIGPRLETREIDGRATGFTPKQRVDMAEAVLKAMSMTGPFARLVVLAGHGSTTVNNPHASGLDCGACGGHTGEANARVAAAILNDPGVRLGLAERGIPVPADTWFLGALHDTTTDEVTLYNPEDVPAELSQDLAQLRQWLAQAGELSRLERSALLGLKDDMAITDKVLDRARDWSQVRPEWGLAGNAAFIAAPRARTRGLELKGRSFLHDYDHAQDTSLGVLELIMTAPMVVASWINLQYYGSTVNNAAFGSGNKVLHNVVGQLGVLEGNAGDLRVGLPWQSVHDGVNYIHEPHRLNVFIEAGEAAMDGVIAKHQGVADLLNNGWVRLHSIADGGATIRRYHGIGDWRTAPTG
jgi:uncharacterized protein YbcC (UPF0753/DUF2309 family)